MKGLLLVAFVALIQVSWATLLIKGPTGPVLEGDNVTIECQYVDSDLNISDVHFESYYKGLRDWRHIWGLSWCCYCRHIEQVGDKLVLRLPDVVRFMGGPYHCVSSNQNVSSSDLSSPPLAFKVHYMDKPWLAKESFRRFRGFPRELTVRKGDDVKINCSSYSSDEPEYSWQKEDSDWILPSSQLLLKKVDESDAGEYTCQAIHPTVGKLSKKSSFVLVVLPEDAPWYQSSDGRLVLVTSGGAVLLLVILSVISVVVCRRVKKAKTSKGPIDDGSLKKPIYKNSLTSIPSTCGDKEPLV
ncbi:leucine-rich repeats and immunoglobulin-like domains protein 2 [Synchiropus picturatus]